MCFLWLANQFIAHRRFEFIHSAAVRPAVYFMIASVVAFGMGQISWFIFAQQAPFDTQLGGFAIYLFSLAMMVMGGNIIKDIRWLKAIVITFVALSMIYVLGRAVLWSTIDVIYEKGYVANSMLWTWLTILPLAQALFNHDLKARARVFLFAIVGLTLYVAVILTNEWKSGWVPAMVGVVVLFALRFKKLAIVSIPFALIGVLYLIPDLISTDQYSWGTRVDAWLVVLDISRANPLLGLGFANYNWYAKVFTIRGYHIRFNSHSQYVDIIAQTGLVGFVCFIWILYAVGILGWKTASQLKDGFARAYAYGVLAGVVACVVAAFLVDWLLPFAYNIGLDGFRASILPWVFFGGLIAIEQMVKENKIS
jgi:O-antigen ligase